MTAIVAGETHTCALLGSGAVKCWGLNFNGELGNGKSGTYEHSTVPVAVVGL